MLCIKLKPRVRACGGVTGGLSDVAIFDPSDFDFTQPAPVAEVKQPYTAISLRAGAVAADGAKMYTVSFQQDEGEFTMKQSKKGCATKYDFELVIQMPENEQGLANFLEALDAAGCCCGVGIVVRYNSGKIFVVGEKYVNAASITRFTMAQDGSDSTSGKAFDDFNGVNLHIKGSYNRPYTQYTGTWASVEALIAGTPETFDTLLDFGVSTSESAAGVNGTVSAIDADQSFEFDAISPRTGTPCTMTVKVSTVTEGAITYTSDYVGRAFKYTDKAGTAHTGVFGASTNTIDF